MARGLVQSRESRASVARRALRQDGADHVVSFLGFVSYGASRRRHALREARRCVLRRGGVIVAVRRPGVSCTIANRALQREGITHVTIGSHNVARTVVELKKDDKAARRMAIEARNVHENHLCPSSTPCCLKGLHWTFAVLTDRAASRVDRGLRQRRGSYK